MSHHDSKSQKRGKVYFIGAGPGDPELLTLKGSRVLKEADCILYDFAAPWIPQAARRDADITHVERSGSARGGAHKKIMGLLRKWAEQGKTVARLAAGDPFIFGKCAEEALELSKAGFEFEVVPGVSSASGAPACAGIPVTFRGISSTVAFVSGNDERTGKTETGWNKIAESAGTLVFLMGLKNIAHIAERLIANGMNPGTEVAVIEQGCTARQRTLVGTLENIGTHAEAGRFTSPSVIVVGPVVGLRAKLAWLEKKPLFGKTILVTRTREQAGVLAERLVAAGAEVIEVPTIKIVSPLSMGSVDESLKKLRGGHYHWVIFTSQNGVELYFRRLHEQGLDSRVFSGSQIAAIGSSTAASLQGHGITADLIPSEFKAEGILEKIGDVSGCNILIARAREARDVLPDSLREKARSVDIAVVYETVVPEESREILLQALRRTDIVTFTSSSTVKNFHLLLEGETLPAGVHCASIGPVTSRTAMDLGFKVSVEAAEYTINGLVDALVSYFGTRE